MPLLFYFLVFFSEIIGTIAGFGSATILLPFALLFFDFKEALVIVAFVHVFGNISRISFFRSGFDKDLIFRFGVPSIIFTVIGALLVNYVPPEFLYGTLGIFLVSYALASILNESVKFTHNGLIEILEGSVSGLFTGLIGTSGALRGSFLNSYHLSKSKFIATSSVIALATDLVRIPVYINEGFFKIEFLLYLPSLYITALLGAFIGKFIVERISPKTFSNIALAVILVIGIKFLQDIFYIN